MSFPNLVDLALALWLWYPCTPCGHSEEQKWGLSTRSYISNVWEVAQVISGKVIALIPGQGVVTWTKICFNHESIILNSFDLVSIELGIVRCSQEYLAVFGEKWSWEFRSLGKHSDQTGKSLLPAQLLQWQQERQFSIVGNQLSAQTHSQHIGTERSTICTSCASLPATPSLVRWKVWVGIQLHAESTTSDPWRPGTPFLISLSNWWKLQLCICHCSNKKGVIYRKISTCSVSQQVEECFTVCHASQQFIKQCVFCRSACLCDLQGKMCEYATSSSQAEFDENWDGFWTRNQINLGTKGKGWMGINLNRIFHAENLRAHLVEWHFNQTPCQYFLI